MKSEMIQFKDLSLARPFPTMKDEDWKYLSLTNLRDTVWSTRLPIADTTELRDLLPTESINVVFVNGKFQKQLSSLSHTHSAIHWELKTSNENAAGDFFGMLNQRFAEEQMILRIESSLRKPLRFIHILTGLEAPHAVFTNVKLDVCANAEVQIEEVFQSVDRKGKHFVCPHLEASVSENAKVRYVLFDQLNGETSLINRANFVVAREASADHLLISSGESLSRHDIKIQLIGENARAKAFGVALARGKRQVDMHTSIEHLSPKTQSRQNYRYLLDEASKGIFNGKVVIPEDCGEVEAIQSNKNILLSNDCEMNTKPELRIDSGDVRCSHGATVGSLNPAEVFYLQSRGISKDVAQQMISRAFIDEVVEGFFEGSSQSALIADIGKFFEQRKK